MFKQIKITDIIQAVVALLALILACTTVNQWKDEKEMDIRLEVYSFIPKAGYIIDEMLTRNPGYNYRTWDSLDSLAYNKFYLDFDLDSLSYALSLKNYYFELYNKNIDEIVELERINQIIHTSGFFKEDSVLVEYIYFASSNIKASYYTHRLLQEAIQVYAIIDEHNLYGTTQYHGLKELNPRQVVHNILLSQKNDMSNATYLNKLRSEITIIP